MTSLKAIILASGNATRMRPLSLDRAKCMLGVMGRPLLEYLVRDLYVGGIDDLIISTRGRFGEIEAWFGNGSAYGVHINYHEVESWHGTAGTARCLMDTMGKGAENFLIIYGDSLLRADFSSLLRSHQVNDAWCTVLVHYPDFAAFLYEPNQSTEISITPRTNYGVLEVASNGRIVRIIEKPRLDEIGNFAHPAANATVYVLRREALENISPDKDSDFPKDLFPKLIAENRPCFAHDIGDGFRLDLGTIPNYITTQMAILKGELPFDLFFPAVGKHQWIGDKTKIDSSCQFSPPYLVGENSQIGPGAHIEGSVIGSNVLIGPGAIIMHSIILNGVQIGARARVVNSILGEHCILGDDVVLSSNSVLGDYCRLGGTNLIMDSSQFRGLIRVQDKETDQ